MSDPAFLLTQRPPIDFQGQRFLVQSLLDGILQRAEAIGRRSALAGGLPGVLYPPGRPEGALVDVEVTAPSTQRIALRLTARAALKALSASGLFVEVPGAETLSLDLELPPSASPERGAVLLLAVTRGADGRPAFSLLTGPADWAALSRWIPLAVLVWRSPETGWTALPHGPRPLNWDALAPADLDRMRTQASRCRRIVERYTSLYPHAGLQGLGLALRGVVRACSAPIDASMLARAVLELRESLPDIGVGFLASVFPLGEAIGAVNDRDFVWLSQLFPGLAWAELRNRMAAIGQISAALTYGASNWRVLPDSFANARWGHRLPLLRRPPDEGDGLQPAIEYRLAEQARVQGPMARMPRGMVVTARAADSAPDAFMVVAFRQPAALRPDTALELRLVGERGDLIRRNTQRLDARVGEACCHLLPVSVTTGIRGQRTEVVTRPASATLLSATILRPSP